jgi:hypothetical protein
MHSCQQRQGYLDQAPPSNISDSRTFSGDRVSIGAIEKRIGLAGTLVGGKVEGKSGNSVIETKFEICVSLCQMIPILILQVVLNAEGCGMATAIEALPPFEKAVTFPINVTKSRAFGNRVKRATCSILYSEGGWSASALHSRQQQERSRRLSLVGMGLSVGGSQVIKALTRAANASLIPSPVLADTQNPRVTRFAVCQASAAASATALGRSDLFPRSNMGMSVPTSLSAICMKLSSWARLCELDRS